MESAHAAGTRRDVRVGIMGLGHLGADAARKLRGSGVSGFRLEPHRQADRGRAALRRGPEALDAFLAQSDILVCLLPLTRATQGILNRRTLAQLPAGAYVINAARGEHLVEEDLAGGP